VVRDLSLAVRDGEFVTLLGPSGCGKTTVLRTIAGFAPPDAGRILLGGRVLSDAGSRTLVPPERRGMGMVFQHYAVWPHLTVAENVAYPLHRARRPRTEIEHRTRAALALVHLEAYARRYPAELSGGQQQRVAVARALAMEPAVLLLDEPLSNLDARLREELRGELQDLHARLGLTVLYVTHDQSEAMSLSGRIAVLFDGRCAQVGTPHDVYERPASPRVAAFVGAANFLPATVGPDDGGGVRVVLRDGAGGRGVVLPRSAAEEGGPTQPGAAVVVGVRPEAFDLADDGALPGTVERVVYLGSRVEYLICVGTLRVRVDGTPPARAAAGDPVRLAIRRARLYAADSL
jgi:iron(III) transport system ATP-binding protein